MERILTNFMAGHNEVGKIGEELAVRFLNKKGYRILERNYRRKWCEIDIVAEQRGRRGFFGDSKEKTLVFVEVKTRRGEKFGSPEESIDWKKRNQLMRSARSFVSFNDYRDSYRIDAVCVVLGDDWKPVRINHYENLTGF
jgi:putative endonuclease